MIAKIVIFILQNHFIMHKYNKAEIIGFVLLVIGTILWVSEEYFAIETLSFINKIGQMVFWVGLLIWALGYMKRENMTNK